MATIHKSTFLYSLGRLYLRLTGWKVLGPMVPAEKCIVITAFHTSNWDFVLGMAVKFVVNRRISWLAKHTLFIWPFGPLLRAVGGIPVERHLRKNVVQQAIDMFQEPGELVLALAPEGTRKKVKVWKSGFYHIALAAKIPIQPMAFDYAEKALVFGDLFQPTGNLESDVQHLRSFFNQHPPRYPELAETEFTLT